MCIRDSSTTATYSALVDWPYGRREELLGVSARASGPADTDTAAEIFADGEREVAVWIYPQDPDLPGLARAAYAESMAEICNRHRVFHAVVNPTELKLAMIGYRPRRRAVVKVSRGDPPEVVYVKVLRARLFDDVLARHRLLLEACLLYTSDSPPGSPGDRQRRVRQRSRRWRRWNCRARSRSPARPDSPG